MALGWIGTTDLDRMSWTCGYCGRTVGGNIGFGRDLVNNDDKRIYTCPYCENPTAFIRERFGAVTQYPGEILGVEIEHLPDDLAALYGEIRRCVQYCAYTAAVMASRKLLMHIAVEKGAEGGRSFVSYVSWLDENHYLPPGSNVWVDEIRKRGNDANHEVVIMDRTDAIRLLDFCEMLLRFIYEFPARVTR